ncbi:lipid-A-disaccharide synthase-related protein [Altericista sp. CCNU0014]|uniref:lipid-A-disaccharide synthase-related protein n=1 Tax=Altericista sp. CCNU0014 TaxID=3082949 RepID=UPI00384EC0C5
MKLLTLSNGHGEDEVAARVLRQLQRRCPDWDLQALPIVGEGRVYEQAGIPIYGSVRAAMPSGGFIYMDRGRVLQDVRSGLPSLTWSQLRDCRRWAADGGAILAVGDVVPLAFAWWSGAPYAFIGTAKSEYYLRGEMDAPQAKPSALWPWSRWLDCVYLPWERALMQHSRCQAAFPRDRLTAQFLQKWPIPVYDLGNPMLDDLEPKGAIARESLPAATATVLLLPGSRPPEAYENWRSILESITPLAVQGQALVFVGAIATLLDFDRLAQTATALGWKMAGHFSCCDVPHCVLVLGQSHLLLVKQAFSDALHLADLAIAMAGTATEQCVGLGKPVITFPGKGPQFIWAFAEAQTRLLGPSIHLVENPSQVAATVVKLLQQPCHAIYQRNGQARMGQPGSAARIAQQLIALEDDFRRGDRR